MMVPEGSSAKLTCKARGYPKPEIVWRREDRGDIIVRDINGGTKIRRNFYSFINNIGRSNLRSCKKF